MSKKRSGVAFFDSGIGGLTVLYECIRRGISQPIYYYGDNEYAPYGNKSREEIRSRVWSAFESFDKMRVQAAVVACNTATAVCVDALRERYDFPIVGAEPAVFSAAKRGGEVLVLTTRATHESGRFRALCQRVEQSCPNTYLRLCPCDGLAGEIETHLFDKNHDFSAYLPIGQPASVVLGCTHYIYLKEYIERFYSCKAYDGNEGMARRLENLLGVQTRKGRDSQPLVTLAQKSPQITFLGECGGYNKRVFEQMFAK